MSIETPNDKITVGEALFEPLANYQKGDVKEQLSVLANVI
jgi:hypothetical protein